MPCFELQVALCVESGLGCSVVLLDRARSGICTTLPVDENILPSMLLLLLALTFI